MLRGGFVGAGVASEPTLAAGMADVEGGNPEEQAGDYCEGEEEGEDFVGHGVTVS
jgi:hypothetical protein